MPDKKIQFNIVNNYGSEESGFVVDLRKKINQEVDKDSLKIEEKASYAKAKLEKAELKLKKKVEKEIYNLEKKIKKIEPNLLKVSRKKNIVRKLSIKKKSFWEKNYNQQLKKFQRAAEIKLNIPRKFLGIKIKRKNTDSWYDPIYFCFNSFNDTDKTFVIF